MTEPLLTPAEFRRAVRHRAGDACEAAIFLSDIECWGMLEVNHIKRRPHCTPEELVDPHNGNLLCKAHHQWVTEHSLDAHDMGLFRWSWE